MNKREKELAEETNKKLIKHLFFIYLLGHKNAFLKAALNILPPY